MYKQLLLFHVTEPKNSLKNYQCLTANACIPINLGKEMIRPYMRLNDGEERETMQRWSICLRHGCGTPQKKERRSKLFNQIKPEESRLSGLREQTTQPLKPWALQDVTRGENGATAMQRFSLECHWKAYTWTGTSCHLFCVGVAGGSRAQHAKPAL